MRYSTYAFVLDSNNNIFFYSLPEYKKSDGAVHDDAEPDTLGLRSNRLSLIEKGTEESFFKRRILDVRTQMRLKPVLFASFNDTITSSFFQYLKTISDDEQNKIYLTIRRALPEERKMIKIKADSVKRVVSK